MTDIIIKTKEFKKWVIGISAKYKQSQIKAAIKVNSEMLSFYFELGREISKTSFKAAYGSKFYDNLSKELISNLPNITGLSPKNLRYMEKFICYIMAKFKFSHNLWKNCFLSLGGIIDVLLISVKILTKQYFM